MFASKGLNMAGLLQCFQWPQVASGLIDLNCTSELTLLVANRIGRIGRMEWIRTSLPLLLQCKDGP